MTNKGDSWVPIYTIFTNALLHLNARHIRTVVGCKPSALEQHIITIFGEHKAKFNQPERFVLWSTSLATWPHAKLDNLFPLLSTSLGHLTSSHFLTYMVPSLHQPSLSPLTWKSCNSSYPPVVEYCRKDCYGTKHFDTLDVKTLWAVRCYIWRVASHAIIFFDLCNESDCCFQWFFFNTVLLETSWYSIEKITLLISLLLP